MTGEHLRDAETTRRALLAGAGMAGVAALAACSSSSSSSSSAAAVPPASAPAASAPAASAASTAAGSGASASSAAGSGGTALGAASEIVVGGGKVFAAEKVVVTQPSAGEYKAFSAVCTHEQCIVNQVAGGTINCPCHGSKFSVKDGSVVAGPAPSPLPAAPQVTVSGGQIKLA